MVDINIRLDKAYKTFMSEMDTIITNINAGLDFDKPHYLRISKRMIEEDINKAVRCFYDSLTWIIAEEIKNEK